MAEIPLRNAGNPTLVTDSSTVLANPAAAQACAEWELLLAASSGNASEDGHSRLLRALHVPVEWGTVAGFADHHGTSALLYESLAELSSDVPEDVLAGLRRSYEGNVRKSLVLARELFRVLDCASALGIELIPYKGIVLSEAYYGDMALRQAGDLDVLVRKSDAMRMKEAVRQLGYTPRVAIPHAAEKAYLDSGYECTFDSPTAKNLLELQWALEPRFYTVDFDMEGLFDRAVEVEAGGRKVKTPSAEDLLLVLSIHAAKHVWERLIWVCDIAQILRRGNLNWEWVQRQARELGVERILHVTLLMTNRLLDAPIPEIVSAVIGEDRAAQEFANRFAREMQAADSYNEIGTSYFRLMMSLRERRMDRWRFVTRLAFTPGPGEWEMLRLPKYLFPLYRVVRMARLAARFARR